MFFGQPRGLSLLPSFLVEVSSGSACIVILTLPSFEKSAADVCVDDSPHDVSNLHSELVNKDRLAGHYSNTSLARILFFCSLSPKRE